MTKEQVIEKLAVVLGEWAWRDSFYGEYVTEQDRESCRKQARSFFKANPDLVLKVECRIVCRDCGGEGITPNTNTPCPTCNGTKYSGTFSEYIPIEET